MLIIGERINATTKRVAEAIGNRDAPFLQELARQQVIMILQHEAFDEIWVFSRVHDQAVAG